MNHIILLMDRHSLSDRFKAFAHACVKLTSRLPASDPLCRVVTYQLIKSSTSSAANYRAACLGQSRAVFKSKLSIVIEEMDESRFWIEFLKDEDLIITKDAAELLNEANELLSIIISARMTMQQHK